jgi:hypothetical protein
MKFLLLHHQLIVEDQVMFEGKNNLQDHPQLGIWLQKKEKEK